MAKQNQSTTHANNVAKVAAAQFQARVDQIRARDGCDPATAMLTAATEYSAELRAWNSADRAARSSRRHVFVCQAPGAANPNAWVTFSGGRGSWGEPSRPIYRAGSIEDGVNALVVSNFSCDLTISEEPWTDDLAAHPDSSAAASMVTIVLPAIAGNPNRLWGFVGLEPNGKFRASPIVVSHGGLAATLRDMVSRTWAEPMPGIARVLQVRPKWAMSDFGFHIVAGKVVPMATAA